MLSGYLVRFTNKMKKENVQNHMKFVRVYSEGLEAQQYPIKDMDNEIKKGQLEKIEKDVQAYALHIKIRLRSDAKKIRNFEHRFHPKRAQRAPTQDEIDGYKRLISEAEVSHRHNNCTDYYFLKVLCAHV